MVLQIVPEWEEIGKGDIKEKVLLLSKIISPVFAA
jgi:hypothetical protein